MRAPAFWSEPGHPAGLVLAPIGWAVGRVTLARMVSEGTRASIPVICIGNPTVGGTGKTPTAALVAERLIAHGRRPAILLRGHGGRLAGPLLVEPGLHGPGDVGDEALLHAACGLTVMSRDRVAGARLAAASGADIVVMDDGFQNPTLAKDLSLLVVDGAAGPGNGLVLPAGPLRAPFLPQIARAGGLVVIGAGEPGEALARQAASLAKPVLTGALVVAPGISARLSGRDCLAFCGIGRPQKFAETLAAAGARNVVLRAFADHYVYTPADAERLLAEARATGLILVTTEKDAVKLSGDARLEELRQVCLIVPVGLRLDQPERLDALLARFMP